MPETHEAGQEDEDCVSDDEDHGAYDVARSV